MFQVGWASACSGRDLGQLVPAAAAGTGRRWRSAPAGAPRRRYPPRRHCAIAECSESTGTIWPGRATPGTSGPPAISDSLLASASVRPARSAASVAARPREPGHPVEHHVTGPGGGFGHTVRPGENLRGAGRPLRAQGFADRGSGLLTLDGHDLGPELDRLAGQQAGIAAAGRQSGYLEPARVAPDDIGGLGADRPSRAQQNDAAWAATGGFHPAIVPGAAAATPVGSPGGDRTRQPPAGHTGTPGA